MLWESPRKRQLEPHDAFELAFGLPAGLRVDLGLAFLAEIVGLQLGERAALDRLLAALLDEGSEHRRLAVLGRQLHAIPAVAAVARVEEVAQQIGLLPVARSVARVAHDADAGEHAALVETRRDDDR